jgi:hypothetical protein
MLPYSFLKIVLILRYRTPPDTHFCIVRYKKIRKILHERFSRRKSSELLTQRKIPRKTEGDFTQWKEYNSYQKSFVRLLRDLKAEAEKKATPEG